jgi:hypothetical protein
MSALETAHADAILRIVASRNIQVNVWLDAPTPEQVRVFSRIGAAHSRRHPRGAALINIMVSGTPSFSEEVRDGIVKLMKLPDMFRLGAAHVVLLDGLTGSAVRTFMSTVMLIGRPPIPNKVFGDAESAAAWLAPLLTQGPEPWTRVEIVQLVKQAARG